MPQRLLNLGSIFKRLWVLEQYWFCQNFH